MKRLFLACLLFMSANTTAGTMELFCTKAQCDRLGISSAVPPAGWKIFVIDQFQHYAKKINETQLKGVTTLRQAEALMPSITSSKDYTQMVQAMKDAGTGINKIVGEYSLKKLPAFVCKKQGDEGELQSAVIYGGSFKQASRRCAAFARGQAQ